MTNTSLLGEEDGISNCPPSPSAPRESSMASEASREVAPPMYVIRHSGAFYRQNAQGYTYSLAEAWRLPKEEAEKYINNDPHHTVTIQAIDELVERVDQELEAAIAKVNVLQNMRAMLQPSVSDVCREAVETEGFDPKDDSAMTEGQTPDQSESFCSKNPLNERSIFASAGMPKGTCIHCGAPILSDEPVEGQPCLDCIMDGPPQSSPGQYTGLIERLRDQYQNYSRQPILNEAAEALSSQAQELERLSKLAADRLAAINVITASLQSDNDRLKARRAELEKALQSGFITCVSGGRSPYVEVSFPTLAEAQNFHRLLIHWPRALTHHSKGGEDV